MGQRGPLYCSLKFGVKIFRVCIAEAIEHDRSKELNKLKASPYVLTAETSFSSSVIYLFVEYISLK